MENKEVLELPLWKLVENNITYSVLNKILHNKCTDIYTNNESFIICYSNPPYPIWVWCKDANNKEDVIAIANYLDKNYLSKGKYNIILSNDLLTELKKVNNIYNHLSLKMEMLSYKLSDLNEINRLCDGYMRKATLDDLDELTILNRDSNLEMENLKFSLEDCKNRVLELINKSSLYIWINKNGEIVSTAGKRVEGKYATVSMVYTVPKHRRKSYAKNLVYNLAKELLDNGLTPILYAKRGYVASNECYEKIGFKQVGILSNVYNK